MDVACDRLVNNIEFEKFEERQEGRYEVCSKILIQDFMEECLPIVTSADTFWRRENWHNIVLS